MCSSRTTVSSASPATAGNSLGRPWRTSGCRCPTTRRSGAGGETLLSLAKTTPGFDDEQLTVLGKVLCDAQSGGLMGGLRATLRSLTGAQPGAESSIAKLLGVEHVQQVWEVAMEWAGPASLLGEQDRRSATQMFLNAQCLSIAGGTTNVQLNIIGERILGLPRDPEPGR